MLTAIPRYGARVIPNTEQTIDAIRAAGQLIEGPHVEAFEQALAERVGAAHAVSASYGRMAFFYLLEALQIPTRIGNHPAGADLLGRAGDWRASPG